MVFSLESGTYAPESKLILSTETENADIYYTENGDNPSSITGTIYSGPIMLSSSVTVKAIA